MSGLISVEFVEDLETGVVTGTKCRATLHPSFVGFNSSSKIDVALR